MFCSANTTKALVTDGERKESRMQRGEKACNMSGTNRFHVNDVDHKQICGLLIILLLTMKGSSMHQSHQSPVCVDGTA